MRVRIDTPQLNRMIADLQSLNMTVNATLNVGMRAIGDAGVAHVRTVYARQTFGNRRYPPRWLGRFGASVRLVTRGTASTQGRSFAIFEATMPYADALQGGQAPGSVSEFDPMLRLWAADKLQAREPLRVTRAIRKRGTKGQPILAEALVGDFSGPFRVEMDVIIQNSLRVALLSTRR